jgi:signal transduction histidine kinase
MTKQEVASLSFRFASLYALVQSVEMLSYAGYYVGASAYGDTGNMLVRLTTVLLGSFFLAGLSWYLWVHAGRLSKTLFHTVGAGDDASHASPMEIQEVAYRVLGLYLFFQAFSRLSSVLGSIVARSNTYQSGVQILPETWVSVATMIVQFALSLWLILGAPKLDEVLRIIRHENDEIEDEPQG